MSKKSELQKLMMAELPGIGYQKRLCYRTSQAEVINLYRLLNREIFDNQLPIPEIEVVPRCRTYWGLCFGEIYKERYQRSYCKIRLMDKWFCKQWLITTLAHEMCHQYQWDIEGAKRLNRGKEPLMSHGPTFFVFKDKLAKHGISLKRAHSQRRWFKTQNLFRS